MYIFVRRNSLSKTPFMAEPPLFLRQRHGKYYRICFGTLVPILIGIVFIALGAFFLPPVSALVFLVLYLYLLAYFSVKTTNLLFNTSNLSHHRFEAGLKTGEYMRLVFTNSLGVAVTLGLFFPLQRSEPFNTNFSIWPCWLPEISRVLLTTRNGR